jgi:hypothetical protein
MKMTTTMTEYKRKGLPKKKKSNDGINIFDFLNDITYHKKFILNETNEHLYSPYQIIKFLATLPRYLSFCDTLNKYMQALDKYEFHQMAIIMCPDVKEFKMFLGTKVNIKPNKDEIKDKLDWIKKYFKVSEDRAYEYYTVLGKERGDELITNIRYLFGIVE